MIPRTIVVRKLLRRTAPPILGLALLAVGCSDNRGDGRGFIGGELGTIEPCPATTPVCVDGGFPTYTKDLAPILGAKCTGCHGPGGETSDKPLTSYAELMKIDTGGRQRGRTSATFVIDCKMPPPPLAPVTDAERTVFYCWLAGKEQE